MLRFSTIFRAGLVALNCFAGLHEAAAENLQRIDRLLDVYGYAPTPTKNEKIRWPHGIAIDISSPSFSQGKVDALPTDKDKLNFLIMDAGFTYALQLARAAQISSRLELDSSRANFFIKTTHIVSAGSYESTVSGERQWVLRTSRGTQKLCSLVLEWRAHWIRTATIEIQEASRKDEVARCLKELVWRAFGFLGEAGSGTDWIDKTLTEDDKKSLLLRLYATSQ